MIFDKSNYSKSSNTTNLVVESNYSVNHYSMLILKSIIRTPLTTTKLTWTVHVSYGALLPAFCDMFDVLIFKVLTRFNPKNAILDFYPSHSKLTYTLETTQSNYVPFNLVAITQL